VLSLWIGKEGGGGGGAVVPCFPPGVMRNGAQNEQAAKSGARSP
jgi:hypothetical protein